jgi:hypothetical protein
VKLIEFITLPWAIISLFHGRRPSPPEETAVVVGASRYEREEIGIGRERGERHAETQAMELNKQKQQP